MSNQEDGFSARSAAVFIEQLLSVSVGDLRDLEAKLLKEQDRVRRALRGEGGRRALEAGKLRLYQHLQATVRRMKSVDVECIKTGFSLLAKLALDLLLTRGGCRNELQSIDVWSGPVVYYIRKIDNYKDIFVAMGYMWNGRVYEIPAHSTPAAADLSQNYLEIILAGQLFVHLETTAARLDGDLASRMCDALDVWIEEPSGSKHLEDTMRTGEYQRQLSAERQRHGQVFGGMVSTLPSHTSSTQQRDGLAQHGQQHGKLAPASQFVESVPGPHADERSTMHGFTNPIPSSETHRRVGTDGVGRGFDTAGRRYAELQYQTATGAVQTEPPRVECQLSGQQERHYPPRQQQLQHEQQQHVEQQIYRDNKDRLHQEPDQQPGQFQQQPYQQQQQQQQQQQRQQLQPWQQPQSQSATYNYADSSVAGTSSSQSSASGQYENTGRSHAPIGVLGSHRSPLQNTTDTCPPNMEFSLPRPGPTESRLERDEGVANIVRQSLGASAIVTPGEATPNSSAGHGQVRLAGGHASVAEPSPHGQDALHLLPQPGTAFDHRFQPGPGYVISSMSSTASGHTPLSTGPRDGSRVQGHSELDAGRLPPTADPSIPPTSHAPSRQHPAPKHASFPTANVHVPRGIQDGTAPANVTAASRPDPVTDLCQSIRQQIPHQSSGALQPVPGRCGGGDILETDMYGSGGMDEEQMRLESDLNSSIIQKPDDANGIENAVMSYNVLRANQPAGSVVRQDAPGQPRAVHSGTPDAVPPVTAPAHNPMRPGDVHTGARTAEQHAAVIQPSIGHHRHFAGEPQTGYTGSNAIDNDADSV